MGFPIFDAIEILTDIADQQFAEYSPTKLIAVTALATVAVQKAYAAQQNFDLKNFKSTSYDGFVKLLTKLPVVGPTIHEAIEREIYNALKDFKKSVDLARTQKTYTQIPLEPVPYQEIEAHCTDTGAKHTPGSLSGAEYVTDYTKEQWALLDSIFNATALTNPMHDAWRQTNQLEGEGIAMCNDLFGNSKGSGIPTSGGTESILAACKMYIEYARDEYGIEKPEILVPSTAHDAFAKAAKYFNAILVTVPVNEKTGTPDIEAMRNAITSRTCMMAASRFSYPYGVTDPIRELAAIAKEYKIPFHSDDCLGGFYNAFLKKLKEQQPELGIKFSEDTFFPPGVTSLSADMHKYGLTIKGFSALLFSPDCPCKPTWSDFDWAGGLYITKSFAGSQNGLFALVVATFLMYGLNHYLKVTKDIYELRQAFVQELKKIDGIILPYVDNQNAQTPVIGIRFANDINPAIVIEQLGKKGWSVNSLQSSTHKLEGFHFVLTAKHTTVKEKMLKQFPADLKAAINYYREEKKHPYAIISPKTPAEKAQMSYIQQAAEWLKESSQKYAPTWFKPINPNLKSKSVLKTYGKLEKNFIPIPAYVLKEIANLYILIKNSPSGYLHGFSDRFEKFIKEDEAILNNNNTLKMEMT